MKNAVCYLLSVIFCAGCASSKYDHAVRSVQLAKSSESWNGHPLPPYQAGAPEITILRITIPPKYTLPMHRHPVINAGVLVKGRLTVTAESGQVLHLKSGDSIVELVDTWHYGTNEADEPAEIIVFYAGIKDGAITIKKPKNQQTPKKPKAGKA